MAQLVEHILGKDEVISSTLISSSRIAALQKQGGFLLFCFLHLFAFFASRSLVRLFSAPGIFRFTLRRPLFFRASLTTVGNAAIIDR